MPETHTQSLAHLLAERGCLTQGQVVTVGVQIARDLAMLHARGHVYADVNAANVLIDENGRPSLAPATSGGGEPTDDLRALADVLRAAAGTNAGLALLRVLGHPMDAAAFARDLYAVCPAAPLLVALPAAGRRQWPRVRFAGALAVLLVVAGFAGVAWARSQSHHTAALVPKLVAPSAHTSSSTSSPQPRPASEDWLAVMSRLDHTRDSAFATGNEAALTAVYAPGSAVLHRELASLRGLVTHNSHARGLHLEISSVSLLARTSMTVTLRVIDRLPAYELVSHGRVVAHHAGRSPRAWRVVLVHSDAAWRIVSIG